MTIKVNYQPLKFDAATKYDEKTSSTKYNDPDVEHSFIQRTIERALVHGMAKIHKDGRISVVVRKPEDNMPTLDDLSDPGYKWYLIQISTQPKHAVRDKYYEKAYVLLDDTAGRWFPAEGSLSRYRSSLFLGSPGQLTFRLTKIDEVFLNAAVADFWKHNIAMQRYRRNLDTSN